MAFDAVEIVLTSNPLNVAGNADTQIFRMGNSRMSMAGKIEWTEVLATGHKPNILTLDGVTYEPVSWGPKIDGKGNILQILYRETVVFDFSPSMQDLTLVYTKYETVDTQQFYTIAYIFGANSDFNTESGGYGGYAMKGREIFAADIKADNIHGDWKPHSFSIHSYDSRDIPKIPSAMRNNVKNVNTRRYKAHTALKDAGYLNVAGRFVLIADVEIENSIK